VHEEMLKEVNNFFVGQPSYPRGGGSNPPIPPRPLGPPGYFGLPMVNPNMPPLPPNGPYRQPFNYLQYVKDSNLDAHVRVF
jgi:hypothetical protein